MRTEMLQVRVTVRDLRQLRVQAAAEGKSVSEYVRDRLGLPLDRLEPLRRYVTGMMAKPTLTAQDLADVKELRDFLRAMVARAGQRGAATARADEPELVASGRN